MYYVTYQFVSQIITVTATHIHADNEHVSFNDKQNVRHILDSATVISILPVRSARRKSAPPQA